MHFVELLSHVVSTILIGYLSLTGILADKIENLFPSESTEATQVVTEENAHAPEDVALNELPSKYEYGGIIPNILLENSQYQKAAVIGASTEPIELTLADVSPEERMGDALVNIFCQYQYKDFIRTTTGTGFFISADGVILTNAHVAQFLLFEHTDAVKNASCTIRGGNPAVALYEAELLYIPPTWVNEHAKLITDEAPIGTGERDYALLYVAYALSGETLPAQFPFMPLDTDLVSRELEDSLVFAGGYPGEALYLEGADAQLEPIIATTTVSEIYTFGSNLGDIFSIYDSAVGKHGASGGPIVQEDGTAIGLIVTKGNPEKEGPQSLRGLTLSYIDRTITEETGFTLSENMQGDLAHRGAIFKDALVPFLSRILTLEL